MIRKIHKSCSKYLMRKLFLFFFIWLLLCCWQTIHLIYFITKKLERFFFKVTCWLARNEHVSHSIISYYLKTQTRIHSTKMLSGCKFNLLFVQHKLILLCNSATAQQNNGEQKRIQQYLLLDDIKLCAALKYCTC